jgi:hypothetical protein
MTKAGFIKIFGEKDGNKLYKLLNSKCNNFCTFWKKTGDSGTNPLTNFLGTIDNVDLVFKTNNTESFRIFKTTQNIGINTTIDNGYKLNINGNLRVNNGFHVATPDTLTSDYITGVLKLPQVTVEAVNRNNLSLRYLIRAGGWHTSTWFGAETLLNWVNNGGGNATQNAAFGFAALKNATTSQNNTATGAFALANILTGSNNTGCGYDAAWLATTAANVSAVGSLALGDVTTGNNNSGFGANSGRGITTGINNTIIGANITGLTANLSDTLIIATGAGGTGSYRIFSPSSGNILIGTTTDAGFRLDVNGTARFGATTVTAQGSLSTDLAFRVRNSANTLDILSVNGSGGTTVLGLAIAQPAGQFYPTLSFSNNGGVGQGSIFGYNSRLCFSSSRIIPGNVLSVNFAYFDANYAQLEVLAKDTLSTSNSFGILNNDLSGYLFKVQNNGSVGIGTTTALLASAKVQIDSTTQGFLPPRMTTTQRDAIVSPATGLVLFNTTTDTLQVRASTGWINL